MKKHSSLALTILSVSLLHAVGIVALSNFDTKEAELLSPQEELTFVELSSGGAPAAAPVAQAPVKPVTQPKTHAEPQVKRTIVKKPQEQQVVERKPDPKPEKTPKKPERQAEQKPERQPERTQTAQAQTQSNTPAHSKGDGNSQQAHGSGTQSGKGDGKGHGGSGNGNGKGNGNGGGDGETSGVKIAGSESCLRPVYPDESIERGESGVARVRWVVSPSGSIASVDVIGSSGSKRLDNAALRQAKKCRFTPAMKGGVPVQNSYTRSYTFKLS